MPITVKEPELDGYVFQYYGDTFSGRATGHDLVIASIFVDGTGEVYARICCGSSVGDFVPLAPLDAISLLCDWYERLYS